MHKGIEFLRICIYIFEDIVYNMIKELIQMKKYFPRIIDKTIDENAPILIKEGGIIKEGVDAELDYYKDLLL